MATSMIVITITDKAEVGTKYTDRIPRNRTLNHNERE